MLTIIEYDPNDLYKRRTGRIAKFPLNTRDEFKAIFGELREGLFIYEKDVTFDNTREVDINEIL